VAAARTWPGRLPIVITPALLIVGGDDVDMLAFNRAALAELRCAKHW